MHSSADFYLFYGSTNQHRCNALRKEYCRSKLSTRLFMGNRLDRQKSETSKYVPNRFAELCQ